MLGDDSEHIKTVWLLVSRKQCIKNASSYVFALYRVFMSLYVSGDDAQTLVYSVITEALSDVLLWSSAAS